ncbi:MAG TPA: acetate--CoA ligase, partial [Magnetospirillum sp.]|nr:acetate--CoA ligase [Magnetospirillum sp.]
ALGERRDKTALIWEGEPGEVRRLNYAELHAEVQKFANALKSLGIQKGDRVAVYMGMTPELAIALLACARIGAVHSVIFGGFAANAIADRVNDSGCVAIITQDTSFRRGGEIQLKRTVDEAMKACHTVKNVVVYRRTGTLVNMVEGRDHWWHNLTAIAPADCPAEPLDSEDPLYILYTSGTTGKPKGLVHTTAGYAVQTYLTTKYVFDLRDEDVYWCTADIGWVTGHSYIVYGPLQNGATVVMYEGAPNWPDFSRFWKIVDDHRVTVFYTAPTAIRAFIKWGDQHVEKHKLDSLRLLGTVGEPINPEAWMWYHKHVGGERCPIVDTFWQTENGGHMITPLPGATPLVPGSCTLPLPGIAAAIVDESGNDMAHGAGGILVVKKPWPSMIRNIWGDPERFKKSYFPEELKGYYLAGDGAVRSEDRGYFRITGRIDDVLYVSGHRMGTMEIESALVAKTDLVAEAAVVGRPDDVTGEAICAFVVLKRPVPHGEEAKQLANELRNWVAKEIGPIAKPKDIRFGENLPKTRSGKIMRRLLRSIAKGEAITQDTSTLENPAILEQLAKTN